MKKLYFLLISAVVAAFTLAFAGHLTTVDENPTPEALRFVLTCDSMSDHVAVDHEKFALYAAKAEALALDSSDSCFIASYRIDDALVRHNTAEAMHYIKYVLAHPGSDPFGYNEYAAYMSLSRLYKLETIEYELGIEADIKAIDCMSRRLKENGHEFPPEIKESLKKSLYSQANDLAMTYRQTGQPDAAIDMLRRLTNLITQQGDTASRDNYWAHLWLYDLLSDRYGCHSQSPDTVRARLYCDSLASLYFSHTPHVNDSPRYVQLRSMAMTYFHTLRDTATTRRYLAMARENIERDNPASFSSMPEYFKVIEYEALTLPNGQQQTEAYRHIWLAAQQTGQPDIIRQANRNYSMRLSADTDSNTRAALDNQLLELAMADPQASPLDRSILESIASRYYYEGKTDSLTRIYQRAMLTAHEYILDAFKTSDSDMRERIWHTYARVPFGIGEELHELAPDRVDAGQVYDNVLFRKGLLLNSSVAVENLIRTQGDTLLMAKFERMTRLRNAMKTQTDSIHDRGRRLSITQAKALADRFEQEALDRAAMLEDYTATLRADWHDVQRALLPGETAVEFTHYTRRDGSQAYAALVLQPQGLPRFVPICPADSLEPLMPKNGTSDYRHLSQLIWQPLAGDLASAKTVCFSPDGDLHAIPMECLPHWADSTRLVSDMARMRRLTSTRTLTDRPTAQHPRTATLYGGLAYDTTPEALAADARKYPALLTMRSAFLADPDSIDANRDAGLTRAAMAYLPASKAEAENIQAQCLGHQIDATLKMGANGTEASLKACSGQHLDILHLATHGFYWTERQAARLKRLGFLADNNALTNEDRALARSGLLMAGANNALRGIAMPHGVDDGIVTAEEISRLDLRALDLVVLSACQSGLGTVTGEGVFGLQRGFKKAGAKTLLVSLWPVDDTATQMLMEAFYRHYLDGHSKTEALDLARADLRAFTQAAHAAPGLDIVNCQQPESLTDAQRRRLARQQLTPAPDAPAMTHPYDNPRFWASFVLVDAL